MMGELLTHKKMVDKKIKKINEVKKLVVKMPYHTSKDRDRVVVIGLKLEMLERMFNKEIKRQQKLLEKGIKNGKDLKWYFKQLNSTQSTAPKKK